MLFLYIQLLQTASIIIMNKLEIAREMQKMRCVRTLIFLIYSTLYKVQCQKSFVRFVKYHMRSNIQELASS